VAFADKVWWTRKSRIETEKRLLSNAFQAQLVLLWYSFCSVAASIYYLQFSARTEYAAVAWLVLSILVLAISGFINGLSFKERAALIKECYETLQRMYERLQNNALSEEDAEAEYAQVLGVCENHTERDYYMAMCHTYLANKSKDDPTGGLDRIPNDYIWFMFTVYKIRSFLFLSLLYLFPLILFFIIEVHSVVNSSV
jgi:hypothetical protein